MEVMLSSLRCREIEYRPSKVQSSLPSPSVLVQKWSLPTEGWVKINVDAALGDSHSSLAMVVRDWRGTGVLVIS